MEAGRSRQLDQWHIVLVGAEGSVITKNLRVLFPQVDLKVRVQKMPSILP